MKLDLLSSVFNWVMKKRFHQIELFLKYPHEVQHEWLMHLLDSAKNTEYGRRYDFESIPNFETFQQRLPITRYESIEADVERLRGGETDIFWPGPIKWFAKSSGTTSSKSKFIPVSAQAIEDCHFKGGKDLLSLYCHNNPQSRIITGHSLRLGGSTYVNNLSNRSYYGDVSAIIIENLPFWVELRRPPNTNISSLSEWEEKLEAMANTTIKEDVTNLAGVPSWMLVLLQRILEKTHSDHILEVWPNLELYMHGGVNFEPYRAQYEKIIPSDAFNYYETYNASEGFFGIQDGNDRQDMLLMLDYGIFYEFIPADQWTAENPQTVGLHEVEVGQNYAVVITTNAGLWRYSIGDTVRFTSVNPYRIVVSGRTKSFINAFGEEVIVENAENALQEACRGSGAEILEYTVAPVYMEGKSSGRHQWMIEFAKAPDDLKNFATILDQKLQDINSDYEAKRYKSMALQFPDVQVARPRLFYDWLKSKGRLGGQYKVPRLQNDRQHLDELLALNV